MSNSELTDNIRKRIASIKKLVDKSTVPGEKKAAELALDRMLKRYNLTDEEVNGINKKEYSFTYVSWNEERLMIAIIEHFLEDSEQVLEEASKETWLGKRRIFLNLEYLDWVTVDSAYEYFRRHMKEQWNKTCAPLVARCRKAKTKNKKRKELQSLFLARYLYASGLLKESDLTERPVTSKAQMERARAAAGVEGGQYNTQVQTAHMLPAAPDHNPSVVANSEGQFSLFS